MLLGAGAALAQEPLLPPDEICATTAMTAERQVDPLLLVRYLVAAGRIGDAALDANGDGDTLFAEKQLALVEPNFCQAAPGRRCTETEQSALEGLRLRLVEFAKAAGGPRYVMQRLRTPTAQERQAAEFLARRFEQSGQAFQAGELLDRTGRFVRVACQAPPPVAVAEGTAAVAPPQPHWVLNAKGVDGVRLTGEVDDLPKNRSKLGNVKPAELSISQDLQEDEKSYQVRAVAGYEFGIERGTSLQTSLIPFLLYERFFDGEIDQIDKLGLGIQEAITVNLADYAKNDFAVTPLYLTDSDLRSDVGLLKLRWTPTLAQSSSIPLGFKREFGPALLQLDLDALADIGRVFDPGDNADLDDEDDFFRLGGRFGLRLRGAPNHWFDQIELSITNKYLTNVGSEIEDLYRLDASLSYLFPDDDHYRLSFAYVNGRTDDTLELTEYWKTQFGVRF